MKKIFLFVPVVLLLGAVPFLLMKKKTIKVGASSLQLGKHAVYGGVKAEGLSLNPYMEVFSRYWHGESFVEYDKLFEKGSSLDEKSFDRWVQFRKKFSVEAQESYEFEMEGRQYVAINYISQNDVIKKHGTVMMKKVGGNWFAFRKEENKKHKNLKDFFISFKPKSLLRILGVEKNDSSNSKFVEALRKRHGSASEIDGVSLKEELLGALNSEDSEMKSFASSLVRRSIVERKVPAFSLTNQDFASNDKFMDYLKEIDIPESNYGELLTLIKRGEHLVAASLLKEIKKSDSVYEYVMKIKSIYGDSKIKALKLQDGETVELKTSDK